MSVWWICPWDNEVTVDDAPCKGIDCSAIPKNVYMIFWYAHSREGEIAYNDRLGVREPFDDFRPLVRYFDAWLHAARRHPKHPITLAQAKFVKSRMVDAVAADGREHKNRIAEMKSINEVVAYRIV
ncbi:MAG TPA: hypothetical protein VKB78_09085 [Pirellulales bacterium]|nr:hypothetical protein [Pirellulales bacterium]